MKPEEIIVRRLIQELKGARKLILGEGIPQLVKPHLGLGVEILEARPSSGSDGVDLVVLEAAEVSEQGDLSLPSPQDLTSLEAERWIVATVHNREDGVPKMVDSCRLPVARPGCVRTVITELGLIEINEVGFVLKEVAPGVATDEVKKKTATSLHVADDIKTMEL